MKKSGLIIIVAIIAIIFLSLGPTLFGGGGVSDEEAVQNALRQDEQNEKEYQMRHERYIDSLVNVACGMDGETLVHNRQNALDILKKEYPQLSKKWDAVQKSIDNMEMYSEDDENTDN
jgi:type II secretory pathway pseudopilin PulG